MAEPTPAPVGTMMVRTPSFSARRQACSGAPPPKAIMVQAAMSWPRSMAWTRAALAMFSSTISVTPAAGQKSLRPSLSPMFFCSAALAAGLVERDLAAGEIGGIDLAQRQVGIGHGGFGAAAAIAGGAGGGARAVRPDRDAPQLVDARDGAAAGADLHHLDHRDAQRQAGALHEAVGARDLELAGALAARHRSAGRSWPWCRPCRRTAPPAGRIPPRSGWRGWRRPPGPIRPGGWGSAPPSPAWSGRRPTSSGTAAP